MQKVTGKDLLGYALAAYSVMLLVIVVVLAQHPWQPSKAPTQTVKIARIERPDFRSIEDVNERKAQFFAYMLPLIEAENLKIKAQRQQLKSIQQEWRREHRLSRKSQRALNALIKQYEVEDEQLSEQLKRLNLRINELPPALVLAQAASESAWGTSRFARNANNFFGQWCFSEGCGLVPRRRLAGATHEVAKFKDVSESVAAYFNNINTFYAYQELRKLRLKLAEQQQPLTALALLPTLGQYSERGDEYLQDLTAIIQQNALE